MNGRNAPAVQVVALPFWGRAGVGNSVSTSHPQSDRDRVPHRVADHGPHRSAVLCGHARRNRSTRRQSNLEFKPYGISALSSDRTGTPQVTNKATGDIGFDVKYGLTRSLTADLTVNTDFAKVEVDDQQINLTRFNLLFPEKRELFLESVGNFRFGGGGTAPQIFYSRQIGLNRGRTVPIVAGGRLTGKVGHLSIGALNIQTGDDSTTGVPHPVPWTHICAMPPGVAHTPRAPRSACDTQASRDARSGCTAPRSWPRRRGRPRGSERFGRGSLAP